MLNAVKASEMQTQASETDAMQKQDSKDEALSTKQDKEEIKDTESSLVPKLIIAAGVIGLGLFLWNK